MQAISIVLATKLSFLRKVLTTFSVYPISNIVCEKKARKSDESDEAAIRFASCVEFSESSFVILSRGSFLP